MGGDEAQYQLDRQLLDIRYKASSSCRLQYLINASFAPCACHISLHGQEHIHILCPTIKI